MCSQGLYNEGLDNYVQLLRGEVYVRIGMYIYEDIWFGIWMKVASDIMDCAKVALSFCYAGRIILVPV